MMLHGIVASSITGNLGGGGEIPEGGFKFWRLAFTGGPKTPADYIILSHVRFYETFFGAQIDVSGVLATTNSLYSSAYDPSYTLTASPQEEYCSLQNPGLGVWITYEFPTPRKFEKIAIWGAGSNLTAANGRFPASITVLGSQDGVTWVTVWGERVMPRISSYASRWLFDDKSKPRYDAAPHKFWRLKYHDTLGNYMYIRQIIAYGLDGAILPMTGVVATANTEYSASYAAANALTNTTSYWSSAAYPPVGTEWFRLEFPTPVALSQIGLNFGGGGGTNRYTGLPYIYVEWSDDGVTWVPVTLILDLTDPPNNTLQEYPMLFTETAPVPSGVSRMHKVMVVKERNPPASITRMQKIIVVKRKVP